MKEKLILRVVVEVLVELEAIQVDRLLQEGDIPVVLVARVDLVVTRADQVHPVEDIPLLVDQVRPVEGIPLPVAQVVLQVQVETMVIDIRQ